MGQPVRVLEEMQAESVTVLKTVQKGYAERAYPPEDWAFRTSVNILTHITAPPI